VADGISKFYERLVYIPDLSFSVFHGFYALDLKRRKGNVATLPGNTLQDFVPATYVEVGDG